MYFMDLKLIAPLKRLNLILETYPVWCKTIVFCFFEGVVDTKGANDDVTDV